MHDAEFPDDIDLPEDVAGLEGDGPRLNRQRTGGLNRPGLPESRTLKG